MTSGYYFDCKKMDIPVNPINIFPDVDIVFVCGFLLKLISFPTIFSSSIVFVYLCCFDFNYKFLLLREMKNVKPSVMSNIMVRARDF